mmetsp:Transcript_3066/g.6147  ORF Transcript_3066/g.6147 Transcript_3066/m.6147 type:complete len:239 (+) Transcript_3066:156-872(+)
MACPTIQFPLQEVRGQSRKSLTVWPSSRMRIDKRRVHHPLEHESQGVEIVLEGVADENGAGCQQLLKLGLHVVQRHLHVRQLRFRDAAELRQIVGHRLCGADERVVELRAVWPDQRNAGEHVACGGQDHLAVEAHEPSAVWISVEALAAIPRRPLALLGRHADPAFFAHHLTGWITTTDTLLCTCQVRRYWRLVLRDVIERWFSARHRRLGLCRKEHANHPAGNARAPLADWKVLDLS